MIINPEDYFGGNLTQKQPNEPKKLDSNFSNNDTLTPLNKKIIVENRTEKLMSDYDDYDDILPKEVQPKPQNLQQTQTQILPTLPREMLTKKSQLSTKASEFPIHTQYIPTQTQHQSSTNIKPLIEKQAQPETQLKTSNLNNNNTNQEIKLSLQDIVAANKKLDQPKKEKSPRKSSDSIEDCEESHSDNSSKTGKESLKSNIQKSHTTVDQKESNQKKRKVNDDNIIKGTTLLLLHSYKYLKRSFNWIDIC